LSGLLIEDGRVIGRMYEDLHALPELRWFWLITVFPTGLSPPIYRGQSADWKIL